MSMTTAFAPAERASQDEVRRQHEMFSALPFVGEFFDAAPNMAMVLNEQRQIVLANRAVAEILGLQEDGELLGKSSDEVFSGSFADILGCRPGEAIGCIRAGLTEGGCGTTPFCRTCGAVHSILNSQQLDALDIQECRLIRGEPGVDESVMDLRVWARPIEVAGEVFTIFSLVDISHEKRRQALERIFFHDVLNAAACVKGLAEMMFQPGMTEAENKEMALMIAESAGQLLEEIGAQQVLSAAESGDLKPAVRAVHSLDVLTQVIRLLHSNSIAKDKKIVLMADSVAVIFFTDPVLLRRVLTNLVKNALEASALGGVVTLGSYPEGGVICFTVHNAGVMSQDVQKQIFSRAFSTKGVGRGLGTYSIKLISEKYLRGRVAFISDAQAGTRFTVSYPEAIPSLGLKP